MKKLNRKGFTLVELLAVIIILAIVVGISIPAITSVINQSKNNALGVVVDSAADYLSDQYGYMNVDYNTASKAFRDVVSGPVTTAKTLAWTDTKQAALLTAMGFLQENVTTVSFTIQDSGVACVTVLTLPTTSEYYSTTYFAVASGVAKPNTTGSNAADYKSRNCA